ncbi:MAG TPA: PIG-L family deacetylase [Phnomibacter sp.]|nr:PIG-L family deacetylase [Phnomibacter sp.]
MMKKIIVLTVIIGCGLSTFSQLPSTKTSSQILQDLKKLKVLGSVLYVAAHPDDENTRLIAWLSNHEMYRTGYLSLTRGDGGQNLIGDEQGVELGLIRTQELLAARRIDGGEQFFSRAYDFGFSKTADETFRMWNKDAVLSDVVWVIRNFQPDVIIARFPEDSRAGHGHHSASGIMARLGYETASDPEKFPEQFSQGVQVWQAKRVLWNTFNFGSANTIDTTTQLAVKVGDYLPLQGKSIGELAGESRSQHKSQGFGVSRQRGNAKEYFSLVEGAKPGKQLMEGVNTTWSRVPGAEDIDASIDQLIANFKADDPSIILPDLRKLRNRLNSISPASYWVKIKRKEVEKLILACSGFYVEAVVSQPEIISGDTTNINISLINRSNYDCKLISMKVGEKNQNIDKKLATNQQLQVTMPVSLTAGVRETQPYWLRNAQTPGMFTVDDQQLIGMAENKPLSVSIQIAFDSMLLTVEQPIQHRRVDPVKAEQYNPAYISDPFLLYSNPGVLLFRKDQKAPASIELNITGTKKVNAQTPVVAITSDSTKYTQQMQPSPFGLGAGDKNTIKIDVPNYLKGSNVERDILHLSFRPGGEYKDAEYFNAKRVIEYDHIPTQTWHYQDGIKVLHISLKTEGKKIGYLPGAGDKIPEALHQMGYTVTVLSEEDLKLSTLQQFDAVITGVRAYNVHNYLAAAYNDLMLYVEKGGNLIVQYNTNNFISSLTGKVAPYDFKIGRTRITDENSKVNFVLPNHPVFNYPNKITQKDFEGWIQERSIYHAEGLNASQWQTPLAFTDTGAGETAEQTGSLAIAPYGKGNFVYTGIVFFRELPAGVPGAYRLFANLIALPGR